MDNKVIRTTKSQLVAVDMFNEPLWNLPATLAWIMWRDPMKVDYWAGKNYPLMALADDEVQGNDPCELIGAKDALVALCRTFRDKKSGLAAHAIEATSNHRIDIPRLDWVDLVFELDSNFDDVFVVRRKNQRPIQYSQIWINSALVQKLWGISKPTATPAKANAARPPKKDDLLKAILLLIRKNDPTEDEIVREVKALYPTATRTPIRTSINDAYTSIGRSRPRPGKRKRQNQPG